MTNQFNLTHIIGSYAVNFTRDALFTPMTGATKKVSEVLQEELSWNQPSPWFDSYRAGILCLGDNYSAAYQLGAAIAELNSGEWEATHAQVSSGRAYWLENTVKGALYWVSEGDGILSAGKVWKDRLVQRYYQDDKGKIIFNGKTWRKGEALPIVSYIRQFEAKHNPEKPVIEIWTWYHLLAMLLTDDLNVVDYSSHKDDVLAGYHKHRLEMVGYSHKLWDYRVVRLDLIDRVANTNQYVVKSFSSMGKDLRPISVKMPQEKLEAALLG